jgi:organic hydroperoxide reductase OsmC/OhrA
MEAPLSKPTHEYATRVIWEGNLGAGTAEYAGYSRKYRMVVAGKPDLAGTADPAFRGERDTHNPEDLFLMSISACHMLTYLALCARKGIKVVAYEDNATGMMRVDGNGGGRFEEITLHPTVSIARNQDPSVAAGLHADAHELCFIASSCAVPIRHQATMQVEER